MKKHEDVNGKDVHTPISFTYANDGERLGATSFDLKDEGKFAFQEDSNSVWVLLNHSPVEWKEMKVEESEGLKTNIIASGPINDGQVVSLNNDGTVSATYSVNVLNWIGISDGNFSDGEEASIYKICDIVDNISGLTPGSKYYVESNGSLTVTGPGVGEIGIALTSNKLLITKIGYGV